MNSRKIAAVLLAGTLALTACGKKDDAEPSSAGETSVSIVESSETETSVSESATSGSEVTFETTDTSVSETESEPTESVVIDYSAEAWYSTNVPVTSVVFYNSTETTWEGTTLPCYFPGTDISFILHPETDAGSLIFNVAYIEADRVSMSQDIDVTSLSEDDYVVRNQTVDANASGDYILDWSDSHVEEWSGMVYVMVTSADGSVDIVAKAAVGVPSLFN